MSVTMRTIFCDDIREEKSGKILLVGTYLDVMGLDAFPAKVTMSMWVQLREIPPGQLNPNISVSVNGDVQHRASTTIEIDPNAITTNIFLTGVPLEITAEGFVSLKVDGLPSIGSSEDRLLVTRNP